MVCAWLLLAVSALASGEACFFRYGDDLKWVDPDLEEDASWLPVHSPHRWPDRHQSSGWYRTSITLPSELRNQPLGLFFGVAASEDQVYCNGLLIGGSGKFGPYQTELPENFPRLYSLPDSVVKWDAPNIIAIRVHRNFQGPAGLLTSAPKIANFHELLVTQRQLTFPFRVSEAVLLGGIIFGSLLIGSVIFQSGNDGVCPVFLSLSLLLAGGLIAESHGLHHLGLRNALTVRIGWACFNLSAPVTLLFLIRFLSRAPGILFRITISASVICALALLFVQDTALLTVPYFICQLLMLGLAVSLITQGIRTGMQGALPLAFGVAGSASLSALAMLEIGGILPGLFSEMPQRSVPLFQAAILVLFLSLLFAIAARFVRSNWIVRDLMRRALSVQDADRRRVARELHDGIGQELQALKMRVRMTETHPFDVPRLEESLNRLIENVRQVSSDLYPQTLSVLALGPAIESHLADLKEILPFTVHQNLSFRERLSEHQETHLFRIFQEGLNNTIKHASAANFHISLQRKESTLRKESIELIIADDGIGYDSGHARGGLGLHTIRERAQALGGTANFRSCARKGTRIIVNIPMERGSQPI